MTASLTRVIACDAVVYTVALRFDAAGTSLCILHDKERLPVLDGVRYQLVARTEDPGEALAVMDLLQKQIDAGEL